MRLPFRRCSTKPTWAGAKVSEKRWSRPATTSAWRSRRPGKRLSPDHLHYAHVGEILLEMDRELSGGRFRQAILNSLRWRDIGRAVVGPRLAPPGPDSHAFSAHSWCPSTGAACPASPIASGGRSPGGGGTTSVKSLFLRTGATNMVAFGVNARKKSRDVCSEGRWSWGLQRSARPATARGFMGNK